MNKRIVRLNWSRLNQIAQIHSPWVDFFCERWQDKQGQLLDYWRVEKADSVIAVPFWRNSIILPPPFFRVGVNQWTHDFPGGRVSQGQSPKESIIGILQRELGIQTDSLLTVEALNPEGWFINSAFSNQKLYGFVVEIKADYPMAQEDMGCLFDKNINGIKLLLAKLQCLQCRAVLLESFQYFTTV